MFKEVSVALLRGYAIKCHNVTPNVRLVSVCGDARKVLARVGGDVKADLVVVGCRGRDGVVARMMGSVSEYVVHHGGVPVMVVRVPSEGE